MSNGAGLESRPRTEAVMPERRNFQNGFTWQTTAGESAPGTVAWLDPDIATVPEDSLDELPPPPRRSISARVRTPATKTIEFDEDPPTIPGYGIEKVLGRCAMSVVYLARQISLNRLVAL